MIVKDLVKILKQHDQDAEVSIGIDDASDENALIIYDNPENADEQTKIIL